MSRTGEQLTATEMGKLWASYLGNSMGACTIGYFLKHVDDPDIKKILEFALDLSHDFTRTIKKIFEENDFPVPVGFKEEDVNWEAPRLFYDEFYLHYLQYVGKAGMSIYSVGIPLITNTAIRDFIVHCLHETTRLMMMVNDLLKAKGRLENAPSVTSPRRIDYVDKQSFLKGYFGDVRPLHGLEVAHLFGCINNDVTSKALMLGFLQGAKTEKVKNYFKRGIRLNQKHIDKLSAKLNEDNLPAPSLLDHLVTPSKIQVFSEKLMMFHKIDMFSMKIREYANGASLNGRRDIGAMYTKCQIDVSLYVEDGANIMIDHAWMEQPPLMIDRGIKK
ncbi:DUF3231 family protein [Pullulanibacillus sp. KACC 23026]|uniref:DUF3231 family protein n=1 Tax=Pullulanibacillus sp. KACC 23026 TaxID=3028315 RepID=UPI0023B14F7C|nr:DUF3231 family protein [Pullulanibacillus sp. KACC 23026]WEG13281.1 DUF3231 family protein [Pullulanibacillus sp. KACC 23026]